MAEQPGLREWTREMLAGAQHGFGKGWLTAKALQDFNRHILTETNVTEIDHPGTAAMAERIAPTGNVQAMPKPPATGSK